MTFKTQMTEDITSVFFNTDEFADTCVYTPKATGIAIPNVAVILDLGTALTQSEYGAIESDTATIKASDVAKPKLYDTFVCNSVTYTVRSITKTVYGVHTLSIDTDQRQNPGA